MRRCYLIISYLKPTRRYASSEVDKWTLQFAVIFTSIRRTRRQTFSKSKDQTNRAKMMIIFTDSSLMLNTTAFFVRASEFFVFILQIERLFRLFWKIIFLFQNSKSLRFCHRISRYTRLSFQTLDEWSFDVFDLSNASSNQPLKYLGYDLLNRYGIFHKFKVSYFHFPSRLYTSPFQH